MCSEKVVGFWVVDQKGIRLGSIMKIKPQGGYAVDLGEILLVKIWL